MSRAQLRKQWEEVVAEFRASGQSASAWCAAHGIPSNQPHYWLRKFFNRRQAELTPLYPLAFGRRMNRLCQTRVPSRGSCGGFSVEVKPGCKPELLKQVI